MAPKYSISWTDYNLLDQFHTVDIWIVFKTVFCGAPLSYAVVPPVDAGLLDSFRRISMECDHWVIEHQ